MKRWEGLRDHPGYVGGAQVSASSSSSTAPPAALVDGTFKTCWSASPGGEADAWLRFDFPRDVAIGSVAFANGFPGPSSHYEPNYRHYHRGQTVKLTFDNGVEERLTLLDFMSPQTHRLTQPVRTRSVRIDIESIYPSSKVIREHPAELRLSEIAFFEARNVLGKGDR